MKSLLNVSFAGLLLLLFTACATTTAPRERTFQAPNTPGLPPTLIDVSDITGAPKQVLFGLDQKGYYLESAIQRGRSIQAQRIDLDRPVGSLVIADRTLTVLHTPWNRTINRPLGTIYVINNRGEIRLVDQVYRADML